MASVDFQVLARALIAADTSPARGNLAAVDLLAPLCAEMGLVVERLPGTDRREANLLAGRAGGPGAPLLLVTHLDTVDPGPPEAWTATAGDPWAPRVEEDRLYGLGSADTKLDALCKLAALERLGSARLSRPVWWLGTFGEETGLRGARAFVESGRLRPAFVCCGEPSDLRLVHGHKGYVVVRVKAALPPRAAPTGARCALTFHGRAAHSAVPHLGENAIEKALAWLVGPGRGAPVVEARGGSGANTVPARCVLVLAGEAARWPGAVPLPPAEEGPDLADALRGLAEEYAAWKACAAALSPHRDPRFEPRTVVTNLGLLDAERRGIAVTFDARLLPAHDPGDLIAAFRAKSRGAVVVERSAAGLAPREDGALVREARAALRELGLEDRPVTKPTSTEAGVFARAGAEAVVFGPGRSVGNAHCPNEHNDFLQISRAIDFYERLIRRLCA